MTNIEFLINRIVSVGKKTNRPKSEFGEQLRTLRKKCKVTMKALADQLGVSESYISRLESGERHPDKELILKMAPILFPEGDQVKLDKLLVAADYTPLSLDQFTGQDDLVHHFQQTLEQQPENFQVYNALVLSLIKQGRLKVARDKIQAGLQTYDDSIHLQVLLGSLELLEGRYDTALLYQQEAIQALAKHPEQAERLFLQPHNMLLNLGVIYFMQGYAAIDDFLETQADSAYHLAHEQLTAAAAALHKALKLAPDDIYILDEYARVSFNLAYLQASAGHRASYAEAIQAFEAVVNSEEKARLNYTELLESTLFLVHAYAKDQNFVAAESRIHLVECCLPNYWMVHYVKACLYNLKYAADPNPDWIQRGLRSLERALKTPDKANRAREEAPHDPDLAHLRAQAPAYFKNVLKLEAIS